MKLALLKTKKLCHSWQRSHLTSHARDPQFESSLWHFYFKWDIHGLFFAYFQFFKQKIQLLQQINVKNVHPASRN